MLVSFPDTHGFHMNATAGSPAYQAYPFDAGAIAHRFRYSAIFGALDALEAGEAMRFVNDHDPIPLLHQMQQRYGGRVEVIYRQRGGDGPVVIDFVVTQ